MSSCVYIPGYSACSTAMHPRRNTLTLSQDKFTESGRCINRSLGARHPHQHWMVVVEVITEPHNIIMRYFTMTHNDNSSINVPGTILPTSGTSMEDKWDPRVPTVASPPSLLLSLHPSSPAPPPNAPLSITTTSYHDPLSPTPAHLSRSVSNSPFAAAHQRLSSIYIHHQSHPSAASHTQTQTSHLRKFTSLPHIATSPSRPPVPRRLVPFLLP